jgi:hypothetical protein
MRFEGSRLISAPAASVWRALRDPEVLEQIIPNCTRIERQPRHHVEGDNDFAFGFEIGRPDETTGAEPIVGWLEVDRQSYQRHMAINLTLNDALTFLRADGIITLYARAHGQETEIHYNFDVRFPGMRGIGWSSQAHANAEATIMTMLDVLPTKLTSTVPSKGSRPSVLLANERGHVVLLPAIEAPATTQSMLRRVIQAERRHLARRQRTIILWAIGGTLGVAATVAAIAWNIAAQRGQPTASQLDD